MSLEITCPGPEAALALVGAARRLKIHAKAREVRGVDRVVVRDGDAISALLTRLGAHDSVLAWEERRMRREVRATANRLANFDDANLRRSARAAVAAGARVERALEILGAEAPEHLTVAGRLRIEHRQASLEELGQLADAAADQGRDRRADPAAAGHGGQAGPRSGRPRHRVQPDAGDDDAVAPEVHGRGSAASPWGQPCSRPGGSVREYTPFATFTLVRPCSDATVTATAAGRRPRTAAAG